MDYWEKKIAAASLTDPVDALRKDKKMVKDIKQELAGLREENRKLTKNNETLVKLVEVMEARIRDLRGFFKDNYVYSFEHGGWVEKDALDRGKIELAPEQLNIDSINNQLAEILRMVERHKMKDV